MMPLTVSMSKFRDTVNGIKDERDGTMIKLAYLLAARNCEILRKSSPSEILRNASKPYGTFLRYKVHDYQLSRGDKPETIKALVFTSAVAKRGKRMKKNPEPEETTLEITKEEVVTALMKYNQKALIRKWHQEGMRIDPLLIKVLLGKVHLKVVALPVSKSYEPWLLDIMKYYRKAWQGKKNEDCVLGFNLERKQFWNLVRNHLDGILPRKGKHSLKNPLRHFRISHLVEYYNFQPYDITSYVGWTIRSTFAGMGVAVNPNLDAYTHLRWKSYFPRLLKPLSSLS